MTTLREEEIDAAAAHLARGGVVAYPTETVYGLGADARSESALAALVALKGREAGRGISLLVGDLDSAAPLLAGAAPPEARALAARFWPGPLTIVLEAAASVSDALRGPSGGVGLRCSSDPWAAALVAKLGAPLTSTSANPSGLEPARSAGEVRRLFAATVADGSLFVVDGGERRESTVSTVIEFSKGRASLLRRGAVSDAALASIIQIPEEPRG